MDNKIKIIIIIRLKFVLIWTVIKINFPIYKVACKCSTNIVIVLTYIILYNL